jgi:hypothetical protein
MYISGLDVADTAWHGGFWGDDLLIAVAVAKAESGWNTTARYTTSQEDSIGLWQINTYAHPQYPVSSLMNQDYNAQAAFEVFHNAGYHWTPWTTYTRGTYLQFMGDARNAVNQLRSLGNNVSAPAPGGQRTGVGGNPTGGVQGIGSADSTESIWTLSAQWQRAWIDQGAIANSINSLLNL